MLRDELYDTKISVRDVVEKPSVHGNQREVSDITRENRVDRFEEMVDIGISKWFNRDNFGALMNKLSGLHDLSGRNCLAVLTQYPDCTFMMSDVKWRSEGYTLKRGEDEVKVMFCRNKPRYDKNGKRISKNRYDIGREYDVSQVEKTGNKSSPYVDFMVGRFNGRTPNETVDSLTKLTIITMHDTRTNVKIDNTIDGVKFKDGALHMNSEKILKNEPTLEILNNLIEEWAKMKLEYSGAFKHGEKIDDASMEACREVVLHYFGIKDKCDIGKSIENVPFWYENKEMKLMFIDNITNTARYIIQEIEKTCIAELDK